MKTSLLIASLLSSSSSIPGYLAVATNWASGVLPFGPTELTQSDPTKQPTLTGDFLEFTTNDYLSTTDTNLLDILLSAEYEVSVLYKPAAGALVDGYIWSAGSTAINNENTLQLRALSSGQLRFLIDGNVGSGASSFTTSMTAMTAGSEYLITVVYSGSSVIIRVNGVAEVGGITGSAHTGALPVDMDTFTVGARQMISQTNFMSGGIKMVEVVAL